VVAVALDDQRMDLLANEDVLEGSLNCGGTGARRAGYRDNWVFDGHGPTPKKDLKFFYFSSLKSLNREF
jgi:hypothetical protein